MAGLEPVVVFWTGWGLHFVVLLSFTLQVTLLLFSDIRRRKDSVVLKVVIWSAYMLADTTAIYALGHMSVVFRWAPEHHGQLMALWAPLLLVHLGGQDNISAYAIEDNRLWLRHLQTFVLQVAATTYVLYISSILSHPNKVSWAAILIFVVGILKYGERIWALKRSNSCASSILSATSYADKVRVSCNPDDEKLSRDTNKRNRRLIFDAYSLLDVAKQMFEGPTTYVQIRNKVAYKGKAEHMLRVVGLQLRMMYDLLYTKAAVVHTWYGLCSRVLISLPFTVTALALFRSSLMSHDDRDAVVAAAAVGYKRADVVVTIVLLTGAVILETMSVLKAIFSKWTAVLLYRRGWNTIGDVVFVVEDLVTVAMGALVGSGPYLSGRMQQHSFFALAYHTDYSKGSKMAKWIGMEDRWDSNVYSWSIEIPELAIQKVLELVSTTEDITGSQGLNAVRRFANNDEKEVTWIWTKEELKLEDRILVWHIATQVYMEWYANHSTNVWLNSDAMFVGQAAKALANYMFSLLAARPYMLPYPVSRHKYVQLFYDAAIRLRVYNLPTLLEGILCQEEALMAGDPLQFELYEETSAASQPPPPLPSMKKVELTLLDRGCQLAAKLIHITAGKRHGSMVQASSASRKQQREQTEIRVDGTEQEEDITEQAIRSNVEGKVVLNMVLEVWVEMLCHTTYWCNENSHAKHLTDGGEIMTIITLLMIYANNGFINPENTRITSDGTTVGPSSSRRAGATVPTDRQTHTPT